MAYHIFVRTLAPEQFKASTSGVVRIDDVAEMINAQDAWEVVQIAATPSLGAGGVTNGITLALVVRDAD